MTRSIYPALVFFFALVAVLPSNPSNAREGGLSPARPNAAVFESDGVQPLAASLEAAPPLIATKDFAGRSAFISFDMSPDGSTLAVRRTVGGREQVLLIDTVTKRTKGRFQLPNNQWVESLQWAGNEKLLSTVRILSDFEGFPIVRSRLFVHNLANDTSFMLEASRMALWGGEPIFVADDGSYALISVQRYGHSYPSVYRYPLEPGAERERIVKSKKGVWDWYADDAGVVRLGMGWRNKRLRVHYRDDADAEFKLIARIKPGEETSRYWSVVKLVSGSDKGYVLEEGDNGRVAVKVFDYTLGQSIETFYENPEWDVEALWLDREGQPLAALYTDDRPQIVWFNEADGQLHEAILSALGMESLSVITQSRNREKALLWAGSEADPGAYYLFNPKAKTVDVFANARPDLDFRLLTRPKPVRYTARDGLEITAYLTLPLGIEPGNLPLIILPHGGPYGVRDMLVYSDEVQFLANRGYAVLQPNFRGSDGYGDAFFDKGRGEIGRGMQDDLDDAMDWAVAEGIADPARVCVVGASYGGYAALWAALRNPERYRCAASFAGVTDLPGQVRYDQGYFTREAGERWKRLLEGEVDFDLETVSPVYHASSLARPVLLVHGKQDRIVPFSQFERFVEASSNSPLPPTTLIMEDEGHSFSAAENEQAWYDALEEFLMAHNPSDRLPSRQHTPATEVEGVEPAEAGERHKSATM